METSEASPRPPDARLGETLAGRYTLTAELGRGGMGVVYRALDGVLQREVAVKLVPPHLLSSEAHLRFAREARLVAQLDHPGIVPIHDFGAHREALFLVMPVLPGSSLRAHLDRGTLRLGDVLEIGIQVAEALAASHARDVVHRDVKPENVMVAPGPDDPPMRSRDAGEPVAWRVRLMDFGLARSLGDDRLTRSDGVLGTPAYLAPEQIAGHGVDARADLHGLGVLLYEALAGAPPFSGAPHALLYRIAHEPAPTLAARGIAVDGELEALILALLAKEPAARPASAAVVAERLRGLRSRLSESAQSRSVAETAAGAVRPAATLPPLVGRDGEVAELLGRLRLAALGEGHLVAIGGAPGVGKTRLLEELERLARSRGAAVLRGRFVEQEAAFPLQGFADVLRDAFRAASGSRGGPDLAELAPDLLACFPQLGEIPQLRAAAERAPAPARPADRGALFELLARALVRCVPAGAEGPEAAESRVLVVLLENVHTSALAAEALRYLHVRLAATPIVLAASYRSDEVDRRHGLARLLDELGDEPRLARLELAPLASRDSRRLVELLLGGGRVSDDVAARVHEAAEGNPLFTRELVRSLGESGGLSLDGTGSWRLTGSASLTADHLPATVQQAVERRLARLDEPLREMLSLAALLGRSFDAGELEALAGEAGASAARDFDATLDRLVAAGLLEEERQGRGERLSFPSAVVRDVLYAAIPRRRRRSLHRHALAALERRAGSRLERVAPRLFHHAAAADLAAETVRHGLEAARRQLAAFSPDEAVPTLRTVLEFLQDEGWEGDAAVVTSARRMLATALRLGGDPDGALRELALAAGEEERRGGDPLPLLVQGAETAWEGRRVEEARRWVERALAEARRRDATDRLPALLGLAATLANLAGRHRLAGEHLAEADRLRQATAAPATPAGDPLAAEPGDITAPGTAAARGGVLRVPNPGDMRTLDPAEAIFTWQTDVVPTVFETLTREGAAARLDPWLAASWEALDGGRRFRFRLRPGVRFHDGRPLGAGDVRASFERLLASAGENRGLLAPVRGAAAILAGEASGLDGCRVLADDLVELELETPFAMFPALLAHPSTAILPAGCARLDGSWRDGTVGTGPFRVVRFEPGAGLELEPNPAYWCAGLPRAAGLVFSFRTAPDEIASGFASGRFGLARDLPPAEVDRLVRDPQPRHQAVEVPTLSTYYLVLNARRGPLADAGLRRELVAALDVPGIVRRQLGRLGVVATRRVPPGLLGHGAPARPGVAAAAGVGPATRALRLAGEEPLNLLVQSVYRATYPGFTGELTAALEAHGFRHRAIELRSDYSRLLASTRVDLFLARWIADYPDADNFLHRLVHSQGLLGSFVGDPEVDRLLERGRSETDPEVRHGLYLEVERRLAERHLLVPLFHEQAWIFAGSGVRGLEPSFTSNHLELEKLSVAAR